MEKCTSYLADLFIISLCLLADKLIKAYVGYILQKLNFDSAVPSTTTTPSVPEKDSSQQAVPASPTKSVNSAVAGDNSTTSAPQPPGDPTATGTDRRNLVGKKFTVTPIDESALNQEPTSGLPEDVRDRSHSTSRQTSVEPEFLGQQTPGGTVQAGIEGKAQLRPIVTESYVMDTPSMSGYTSQENTVNRTRQRTEQMNFENLKHRLDQLTGSQKHEAKGQGVGGVAAGSQPSSLPTTPHFPPGTDASQIPGTQPQVTSSASSEGPNVSGSGTAIVSQLPVGQPQGTQPPAVLPQATQGQPIQSQTQPQRPPPQPNPQTTGPSYAQQVSQPQGTVQGVPVQPPLHPQQAPTQSGGQQPGQTQLTSVLQTVPTAVAQGVQAANVPLFQQFSPAHLLQAQYIQQQMQQQHQQQQLQQQYQQLLGQQLLGQHLAQQQYSQQLLNQQPMSSTMATAQIIQQAAAAQAAQQIAQQQRNAAVSQMLSAPNMSPRRLVEVQAHFDAGLSTSSGVVQPPQTLSFQPVSQQSPPHIPISVSSMYQTSTPSKTSAGLSMSGVDTASKPRRVDRPPDLANLEQALIEKLHGNRKGHFHLVPTTPIHQYVHGQEMLATPGQLLPDQVAFQHPNSPVAMTPVLMQGQHLGHSTIETPLSPIKNASAPSLLGLQNLDNMIASATGSTSSQAVSVESGHTNSEIIHSLSAPALPIGSQSVVHQTTTGTEADQAASATGTAKPRAIDATQIITGKPPVQTKKGRFSVTVVHENPLNPQETPTPEKAVTSLVTGKDTVDFGRDIKDTEPPSEVDFVKPAEPAPKSVAAAAAAKKKTARRSRFLVTTVKEDIISTPPHELPDTLIPKTHVAAPPNKTGMTSVSQHMVDSPSATGGALAEAHTSNTTTISSSAGLSAPQASVTQTSSVTAVATNKTSSASHPEERPLPVFGSSTAGLGMVENQASQPVSLSSRDVYNCAIAVTTSQMANQALSAPQAAPNQGCPFVMSEGSVTQFPSLSNVSIVHGNLSASSLAGADSNLMLGTSGVANPTVPDWLGFNSGSLDRTQSLACLSSVHPNQYNLNMCRRSSMGSGLTQTSGVEPLHRRLSQPAISLTPVSKTLHPSPRPWTSLSNTATSEAIDGANLHQQHIQTAVTAAPFLEVCFLLKLTHGQITWQTAHSLKDPHTIQFMLDLVYTIET